MKTGTGFGMRNKWSVSNPCVLLDAGRVGRMVVAAVTTDKLANPIQFSSSQRDKPQP